MTETAATYTTDADLSHKILTLLKRGPYMKQEIARYCRPASSEEVLDVLLRMERDGAVRYLGGVDLYALVDA